MLLQIAKFPFLWLNNTPLCSHVCTHRVMHYIHTASSRQHIKKQRYYFADIGPSSQSYGFSISHVCMWVLDCKERWVPKNWCFWTVVLEKTLKESLGLQGDQTSPSWRSMWRVHVLPKADITRKVPAKPNTLIQGIKVPTPSVGEYRSLELSCIALLCL